MPFGRWQGHPLEDLPDDYLYWLADLDLRQPLRRHVDAEVARREAAHAPPPAIAPELLIAARAIVTRGYRELARERHPDVGGEHDDMVALSAAAEALRTLLDRQAPEPSSAEEEAA